MHALLDLSLLRLAFGLSTFSGSGWTDYRLMLCGNRLPETIMAVGVFLHVNCFAVTCEELKR
jgi:hypothetical protein